MRSCGLRSLDLDAQKAAAPAVAAWLIPRVGATDLGRIRVVNPYAYGPHAQRMHASRRVQRGSGGNAASATLDSVECVCRYGFTCFLSELSVSLDAAPAA